MNSLVLGLGLGALNGGVNYLADNMWDKQIKSLTKDQQEIARFSSDLDSTKRSALNTILGLYPDLKSARKDPTLPLFLSSIGNKAGPTKYKSDFVSSLISGISDSLKSIDYSVLFRKPKQKSTTVEITQPSTTKSTPTQPTLIEKNYWNQTPHSNFFNNIEDIRNKIPTFSARDYILDSHQNKII